MREKLRIVFVLTVGGVAATGGFRIVAGYAEKLKARGHDVTIVAPRGAPVVPAKLRSKVRHCWKRLFVRSDNGAVPFIADEDIKIVKVAGKNRLDPADFPDADIYIASWWETAEWLDGVPAGAAKAHFVQGYEVFPYLPVERVHAVYSSPIEKIVVSEWLRAKLSDNYGQPSVIVENAIDYDQLAQGPRKKNNTPAVGFLHSITESKNSARAIEACRLLRKQFPDLRVVAFGSSKPKGSDKLPAWIEFSLRPPQDKIAEIYGSCDAWLFSSDEEGFGLPILEAMAAGTPVVATPAGAAPQLVHAGNGALVDHDANALAAAAARILLLQPAEWKKMSQAAENTARKRSWDDATDEFETALYDIVERKRDEFIKN